MRKVIFIRVFRELVKLEANGNDVDEVPQASWCVVLSVKVDVDAAGGVREASGFSDPSHQFLQGFDVFPVGEDGADQFNAVVSAGRYFLSALLLLAVDAAVVHELPNPAVRCGYLFRVVVGAAFAVCTL